jgi:probable HAF family extracellular repeat protein
MKQLPAIAQTFILTSFSFSALSLFAISPAQSASFRGLGFLNFNNQSSSANGVSADGSVIVGTSSGINGSEAFRWTEETGMVGVGFSINNQYFDSSAKDVSADGSVIVGFALNRGDGNRVYVNAFRWTQETGMVGLGTLTNDSFVSYGRAVSADGSVIVGGSHSGGLFGTKAFRWTQETGMVSLEAPGGSYRGESSAEGVSADGSVIVGSGQDSKTETGRPRTEAFRWTESGGIVGLDFLDGLYDKANAVSADGSIVVGYSGSEAFRWTQETGIVGLGFLSNSSSSVANDVSSDGSIVVGSSGDQAFRWIQSDGMVSLKETLIGEGLDVNGWTLTSANAISADGFTIVGNGINPSGQTEAWVANLEPIPEPLTILGSMAAIAFAAGFERKFSKNKSEEKDPDD